MGYSASMDVSRPELVYESEVPACCGGARPEAELPRPQTVAGTERL